MFTNLWLECSEISLSIIEKKARKKSQKRSNIVQFGRWRYSFSSALCSIEHALPTNDGACYIRTSLKRKIKKPSEARKTFTKEDKQEQIRRPKA